MNCPECGASVAAGASFCPECGSEIDLPDTPSGEDEGLAAKIPGMKPGSTVRNVAIGVVIVLVVLSLLGAALPGTDTPDDSDAGLDDGGDGDDPGDGETTPDDADTPTETDGGGSGGAATATPTVTATPNPEPTATSQSTPETQSYSGNGQRVTDTVTIEGGLTVFTMDHDGSSNFQVELIDEDTGETQEYLANEIGAWQATQPFYVPPGNYVLDVNADGNWNIEVAQLRPTESEVNDLPVSASDQYPNYIGPVRFDGLHTFSAEYNGDGNFAVWVLDEDGREQDLIFNEIGQFEGQNTYSGNHVGYIRVEATGDWQLEAE